MPNFLITGGSRGIGLELASQLVKLPASHDISTVYVTTRGSPSPQLAELMAESAGRVVEIRCEVTNEASIKQAAADLEVMLGGEGLDVLVNNVGTMPSNPGGIRSMDGDQLMDTFNINVVSAHRVTAAFIPLLQRGKDKKIIMISTTVGSISYARNFAANPSPQYKITKAAMNMLTVQYALEYEKEGFTVMAVSPGWLKTELGSQYADLEVEVGINAVKDIILKTDPTMNGKFYNISVPGWENAAGPNRYDGGEVPW